MCIAYTTYLINIPVLSEIAIKIVIYSPLTYLTINLGWLTVYKVRHLKKKDLQVGSHKTYRGDT